MIREKGRGCRPGLEIGPAGFEKQTVNFNKPAKRSYGYRSAEHLRRLIRLISKLQRESYNSVVKQKDHDSEENALVKHTRRLGYATWVIGIIGFLSFGASFLQWDALRRADETTREAFTAVQRPFVTATGLVFYQQAYGASIPQYLEIRSELENSGNTPTNGMSVTSAVYFNTPIIPDTPPDPGELTRTDDPPPLLGDYFLGPHGKTEVDAVSVLYNTMDELARNRLDFMVYGITRYFDQFPNTPERITKFCFYVKPFIRNNGRADAQNHGRCHHWNCGDQDCDRDKRAYEAELSDLRKMNPTAAEIKHPVPIGTILPQFPVGIIKAQ